MTAGLPGCQGAQSIAKKDASSVRRGVPVSQHTVTKASIGDEAACRSRPFRDADFIIFCHVVFGIPNHTSLARRRDMKSFAEKFVRFIKEEDGPTAVEYAVMMALIIVVCLGSVGLIGQKADEKFTLIADELAK